MTHKLYDADSHQKTFTAKTVRCTAYQDKWCVVLDSTAFFPESGGQYGDRGSLNGIPVLDTRLMDGEICHITEKPLEAGSAVFGVLDWECRFRRMQNHSGEHILSGLVYQKYGYHNVGFHLADGDVTVDFDGELNREQLEELEILANRKITENVPVICRYPRQEELQKLEYRSKLDLTENVRLVEITGCDLCACCAPHVKSTGEIGSLHILDFMRHRGGTRLHMLCGMDALEDAHRRYLATLEISGLLSVPQLDTPEAVRRCLRELEEQKTRLYAAKQEILNLLTESIQPDEGNICLFYEEMEPDSLRELVNAGMQKTPGICAAFSGRDGDYKYIIGSRSNDLRQAAKEINAALHGRGGGRPEMIQGSCTAAASEIRAWFHCREA